MITSVYIGNDSIKLMYGQVASNKIQIKSCVREPLEEGLILNGVLLNPGVIQTKLDELFKNSGIPKKSIHLVIDGSAVSVKTLNVPLMPPKKMFPVIQNEFTDINLTGMMIDYSIITPKNEEGSATIMASIVQREFVENYVKLFREIKAELEWIDISANCIMKLCRKIKALSGTTFTLMNMDRNMLIQTLFVNNTFKMVKRSRILSQIGTEEFDREIAKNIMNMIQFNRSEKTGSDIGCAYLCGFPEEQRQFFIQYREALGVDVTSFPVVSNEIVMPVGMQPTDWVYNLGSMFYTN